MKEVTVTVRTRVTDEFYENEMEEVVGEIKSGKFQRDMLSESQEITKVTATVQVINIKKK